MTDIIAAVHGAMRDRCIYRPIDIANETRLDVKQVYPALRQLNRGGVIEKVQNKPSAFVTKQLDLLCTATTG